MSLRQAQRPVTEPVEVTLSESHVQSHSRQGILKIAIACFAGIGGSGIVATELGIGLSERGHEVHFVCVDIPFRLDEMRDNLLFHQVHLYPYPVLQSPQYDLALACRLSEVIDEYKIDILHVHYAIPHAISAYLARQITTHQFKIITTLHGTDTRLVGLDPSYRPIMKFSLDQSDGLTAVSKYLGTSTSEDFNITKPIEVLYNFVDTNRFTRKPVHCSFRVNYAHCDERLLIHISNLRPVKRLVDVIKVFAKIDKEVPSRLIIVGDGPDKLAAQQIAFELQVAEKITFTGSIAHIEDLLSISDLFLLTSEIESFGLAALEAMACGTPVVSYATGGVPEVVIDGETGALVPMYDINAMAEAAVEILRDDEKLARYRVASREHAVNHFGREVGLNKYEEYYRKLTGESE